MGDVLIRGLSEAAVDRIEADAAVRGLSRQEYLKRRFEAEGRVAAPAGSRLSVEDLRRAAAAAADLDDPEVMDRAW